MRLRSRFLQGAITLFLITLFLFLPLGTKAEGTEIENNTITLDEQYGKFSIGSIDSITLEGNGVSVKSATLSGSVADKSVTVDIVLNPGIDLTTDIKAVFSVTKNNGYPKIISKAVAETVAASQYIGYADEENGTYSTSLKNAKPIEVYVFEKKKDAQNITANGTLFTINFSVETETTIMLDEQYGKFSVGSIDSITLEGNGVSVKSATLSGSVADKSVTVDIVLNPGIDLTTDIKAVFSVTKNNGYPKIISKAVAETVAASQYIGYADEENGTYSTSLKNAKPIEVYVFEKKKDAQNITANGTLFTINISADNQGGGESALSILKDAEILEDTGVFIYKPFLFSVDDSVFPDEIGKGKIVAPYGVDTVKLQLSLSSADADVYIVDNDTAILCTKDVDDATKCTLMIPSLPANDGPAMTTVSLKAGGHEDERYTFYCYTQQYDDLPDSVADYLCVNSQYTNGGNQWNPCVGINAVATLSGLGDGYNTTSNNLENPPFSLGNFGGYITYYYKDGITNDPRNPFGIDFIVFGNSYLPNYDYYEAGSVLVSEDGQTWYVLAASDHYDDTTIWNQEVHYYPDTSGTRFVVFDQNNPNDSLTTQTDYKFPDSEFYPLYSFLTDDHDEIVVSGTWTKSSFPTFGYADHGIRSNSNIAFNPYEADVSALETDQTDGFDLAWAVDQDGFPIDISNKTFHYIKIQSAFNSVSSNTGELSAEINMVRLAEASNSNVGITEAPKSISIDGHHVEILEGINTYSAEISGPFGVIVEASEEANVMINGKAGTSASFSSIPYHKMLRVIVQEGEKAPWIAYIKLSDSAASSTLSTITLDAGENGIVGYTAIRKAVGRPADGSSTMQIATDEGMNGVALPIPWISGSIPVGSNLATKEFVGWQYGIYILTTFDSSILTDGATLTPIWKDIGSPVEETDIHVSLRLIGSSKSSADVDLSTGNYNGAVYQTWIPTDEYTISTTDTMLDLLKTAADAAGIAYEDSGNYIKSVTAPEAFGGTKLNAMDNGPKSGWMYTVNGDHGLLGVSQQTLANGDSVVFHYVDDYSYEVADWDRLGGTGYPAQSDSTYHNAWLKAVDKVTLSESELVLTLGETESADLTATVTPADAVYDTLTWASSKDTVATVANGKVTAVAAGTADITATAGGITATCKVTVKEPDTVLAESVTLNKSELSLTVGGSEKLTATVLPENTTDKTVVWTSSKDSVATVSSDGTVTAVSVGDAVITATCGAKSDECKVSVTAAPGTVTEVKLNKSTLPLTVGDTETLVATILPSDAGVTVNWSSSAENIATVDDNGKITAVAPGPATITAEAGGKSATCEVTVTEKVEFDNTVLGKTAEYVYNTVTEPTLAQVGGEWAILGLARSGFDVPEAYYQGYYARLVAAVKSESGNLGKAYTEYSRIILALTALGKDPTSVGDYDLLARLGDYDKTIWQGNNSTIFALIALDAGSYEIPTNADAATQATRQMYIELLLQNQLNDGGWTLDSTGGAGSSGVDYTAMALQALAKYKDQPAVATAIDKALTRLSELQNDDGGFSFGSDGANAESAAQVIVALDELGISLDDARFVKNGKTVLDALLTFRNDDGSFKHLASDTISNQMATEQALYALVSADRAKNGKPTLYTMSDHLNISGDGTAIPVASITLNKSSESVEVGKTVALTATVLPVNATSKSVIWTSSDISIATVKNGDVTGVKEGTATITAKAADFTATCTVTVTEASTPTPQKTKIRVTFSLLGDTVHDSTADGKVHGLKMGGLTTWIASTSYELEECSTVKDLFEKALTEAGMTWSNPPGDNNYVESITRNGVTLGEFTNGANSGWMYTLNGDKHPNKGYAEQVLSDGDVVTWHYTDDWTKESDAEDLSQPDPGFSGSTKKDEKTDTAEPVVENGEVTVTAEVTDGEAKAEVTEESVTEALKDAENADVLTVKVDTEDADSVELALSSDALKAAADADVDLHVATENGTVKVDSDTLGELAESGKDIAVTVKANDDGTTTIDITADGESVDATVKVELPAAEDNQVLVIVKEDGTEEIVKKSLVEDGKAFAEIPAGATVKVIENDKDFADVAEDAWYAEAVDFASSHELFQGTNNGFEPNTTMSRAMLVTVLYRLEDATATGDSTFADVDPAAWYAEAAAWANETGIVTGTNNGFEPNAPVTREQIATILYRYANVIGLDTSTKSELTSFPNGGETSSWAGDAMAWAVSVGLFQGDDTGALNPKGDATRAQVATLMMRVVKLIVT